MKDMFLAEEIGYDPYEPFPPDENILTEEDIRNSASNIKFIISFRHDIAVKCFFNRYSTMFKGVIICCTRQVCGIDSFTEDNTMILPFPDYIMNYSRAAYQDYQEVLFYVNRRIEINKTKPSAR